MDKEAWRSIHVGKNVIHRGLCGVEDAGKTCAWMGSCANQVEAGDVRVLVGRTEVGALRELGRNGERRTLESSEFTFEGFGCDVPTGGDVVAEVGHFDFEGFDDAITVGFSDFVPVNIGSTQMRDWCQHVGSAATIGCQTRVGDRGNVQVEAEVFGEFAALEDVIKQAFVCLLYTSPSPRDRTRSRMPSSA